VVALRGTEPVLVRHLGDVRVGPAMKLGEGSHDGRPGVVLGIQEQPGRNTLALWKRLDAELDAIQRTLPEGMEIDRGIFRQSDFIEVALGNVLGALRDGAVLVIAIVFLLLVRLFGPAPLPGLSALAPHSETLILTVVMSSFRRTTRCVTTCRPPVVRLDEAQRRRARRSARALPCLRTR